LLKENLIPAGKDPLAIFDHERSNITEFDKLLNIRRASVHLVEENIKALDDIDNANITMILPEQEPIIIIVSIIPKKGSDIILNREKIDFVQKIVMTVFIGLSNENIVITDSNGMVLNSF
jgi:flagellar M-ring protein FliF